MTQRGIVRVLTGSLQGLSGQRVVVEVDLAPTLPGFSLVGLPSTTLRESEQRLHSALRNAGFHWPDHRITVNLAPADLRKDGAAMDLALALGILVASGQLELSDTTLASTLVVGELALDGALRRAKGAVALGLDARALGAQAALAAQEQVVDLSLVPDLRVVGVAHLSELASALARLESGASVTRRELPAPERRGPGLIGVHGQRRAKRALVIAAAGGHHLALEGPPGCGKTMLARRLPDLLPPLDEVVARDRLRILSCSGAVLDATNIRRPPFRAPHHTVTAAGLIGGGRPLGAGEATLAHGGVLLLDEAGEFAAGRLDLLREPLSSGEISHSRSGENVSFPARFQLVLTTNPCPCGFFGRTTGNCRCLPFEVARYRRRLSGPLVDRIDLWVPMERESARNWWGDGLVNGEGEGLEDTLAAIDAARAVANARGALNRDLRGDALARAVVLDADTQEVTSQWADRGTLSLRAVASTLRVARTIADLRGDHQVERKDLAEAMAFRRP